ncbi:MAG: hypothetical protein PUG78_01275 [Eubacteriales bacterium]|jgi:ABC-type Fe3+ transport system permease subunit|nr:hypothetical protein [Clostridiales bacterium]MDD7307021.1 hypothetical protein [Eubacteriales bacterium]MDY2932646.1 hypothetical protein [Anaerovoracaceae bacterium]
MKKNYTNEEIAELEKLNKELEECCRALSCEDLSFFRLIADSLIKSK